jgi:PqqD family protein of HPr-rel-A system
VTEKVATIVFRVEPGETRLSRDVGLMTLVYHRRSGITHMVNEPVPQVLEALDAIGPADAGAVARHLLGSFDLRAEDGGSVEAVIAARLDELAALGLVVREGA